MKKIFIPLYILTLLFVTIVIIRLLGYEYNKNYLHEFLSYNKTECDAREYPTSPGHSGIQGCVFWMRNNYIERIQGWFASFRRDSNYCDSKYPPEKASGFVRMLGSDYNDPKCTYEAFKKQKQQENWDYLVSSEKDGFYNYCLEQACPRPKMFK